MPRPVSDNLSLHATGQWYKRFKGKNFYFGTDETRAYEQWLKDKPYILAGKTPPRHDGRATVVELANLYAAEQATQLEAGEIGQRHATLCEQTIRRFIDIVGKDCRPLDLSPLEWGKVRSSLAEPVKRAKPVRGKVYGRTVKRRSASTVAGDVRRIRAFLSWCVDSELLSGSPRWGRNFNPETASASRGDAEADLFDPEKLRAIIQSATIGFRPIILLGINAGIGGWDIANMRTDQLPKGKGEPWVSLPRLKTGTPRRFCLWPETLAAIKAYRTWRPQPLRSADAGRLFLTTSGSPWIVVEKNRHKDSIGTTFRRLRIAQGLTSGTFYDLRRQFQTTGAETLDFPAVKFIMGHEKRARDMSDLYTKKISDERLKKITDHVRQWLFGDAKKNL